MRLKGGFSLEPRSRSAQKIQYVKYGHFRPNLTEYNSRHFECVNRTESVTNFQSGLGADFLLKRCVGLSSEPEAWFLLT